MPLTRAALAGLLRELAEFLVLRALDHSNRRLRRAERCAARLMRIAKRLDPQP